MQLYNRVLKGEHGATEYVCICDKLVITLSDE